jgi:hypothetical protein
VCCRAQTELLLATLCRKQKEILDRQAEQARKREREAEEKRMEEKRLEQERAAVSSNWRRNPTGAVPLPPSQLRSERDVDRDVTDGPRKDRDADWRGKNSAPPPAPAVARDEAPPRPKPEAWRPSGKKFESVFISIVFKNGICVEVQIACNPSAHM